MANESRSSDENERLDTFWLRSLYPDASNALIFAQQPLGSMKDDCLVIVDTNILLFPYKLAANSLSEIEKIFLLLRQQDRIFVPEHAVREFIKNRADRIRDILRELNSKASQINIVSDRRIGFLESDENYKNLVEISEKVRDLKSDILKSISNINESLRNGIGSDPVSVAWRGVFADRIISLDDSCKDEDLISEMQWRYKHSVPPGYKDNLSQMMVSAIFLYGKLFFKSRVRERKIAFL